MKNVNLILFVISFVLMGLGSNLLLVAGKPGGVSHDLTETTFYIYNKANLDSVAVAVNDPNNWWKSLGKTFILDADIATFTNVIGTDASPFRGTFDGNGHRIDVYIYKPTQNRIALFGRADNAYITRLTVTGYVRGAYDVGGLLLVLM